MNQIKSKRLIPLLFTTLTLTACGGSNNGSSGDNGGSSGGDQVQNQAPTAVAGEDATVNEQTQVTLTGSGTDSDGTISTYSWTQTAGTAVTLDSAASASSTFTSPTLTETEQLTFELTVTDDGGETATDSVSITVNPVNELPQASAGDDQIVHTQSTVTLAGSGTDSDGEIVQYQWTQTTGDTVTINQASQQNATFTAPINEQTLTFELATTDNEGGVATDTVSIVVENPIPFSLLDSAQQALAYAPGTELIWSVENYDPQVQTLSWSVTSDSPLKATTLGESLQHPHQVSFTTLELAQNTDVTIQVSVADGDNTHVLTKTITMLAEGEVKFTATDYAGATLASLDKARVMKVADLNHDGYKDIVHINTTGLNVLYGAADNTFTAAYIGAGEQLKDFQIVDINADGLDDLLISYSNSLVWNANLGGTDGFGTTQSLPLPSGIEATSAHVGDLDNDNDNDIAVIYRITTTTTPQLAWFEKDGANFKAAAIIDSEINPWDNSYEQPHFTLGDFNNDGKTDILVATSSTNDARPFMLYTQTDSGFNKTESFYMNVNDIYTSIYNDNIITVDINQDGFDDLVTWQSGTIQSSRLSASHYHINQKDGTFATENLKSAQGEKLTLYSADMDGDGDTDIVTAANTYTSTCGVGCTTVNRYAGNIAWIENTGQTFANELKVLGNPDLGLSSQIGDIDNDGDIDVINLNPVNTNVWIYHNQRN